MCSLGRALRRLAHAHALRFVAVGVLSSGVVACGQQAPEAPLAEAPEPSAPEPTVHEPAALELSDEESQRLVRAAVEEVFGRMAAGDCAGLDELVAGAVAERMAGHGGCEQMMREDPGAMAMTLVAMEPPRRDGRNPRAWMVPLQLRSDDDEEMPSLARVEWLEGRFRLVAM